ncbi:hypothetical protein GB937_000792 [Aspergillus fischeri]|nr:hypothetical protein GB937_000792 [Aspergillus fischeri]
MNHLAELPNHYCCRQYCLTGFIFAWWLPEHPHQQHRPISHLPCSGHLNQRGQASFNINFWGVFAITQAFILLLLAAKNGSILINVYSILGFLYTPWIIQTHSVGNDILNKSAPADFAHEVVKDILGRATGPMWRRAMASIVKFMSKYMPTGILVSGIMLFHSLFLFNMN